MTWARWLVAAAGISIALYALAVAVLLLAGRRESARALARFVPDCIVLFKRLATDVRVPRRHKLLLLIAVGYLVMPFDLIPDFIPVIGQFDDAILVAVVLRLVLRGGGSGLLTELWPGPGGSLGALRRGAGLPPAGSPR